MDYEFPEILKRLREQKGLSIRQLAKMAGFSQAAICRWEQGTQVPNIQTLVTFANLFEVSADYLLGMEKEA